MIIPSSATPVAARAMARQGIEVLASFDHIVTGCATCGTTLKHYTTLVENDPKLRDKPRDFLVKIADLSQFLVQSHIQPMGKTGTSVKITCHEPCCLKWRQGAGDFPC